MFTPSRLSFARKRRGKTKTELANLIGRTQQAISDIESGRYFPSDDTLQDIADALNFPIDFFSGPELKEPSTDTASFRSLKKMTAAQRNSALCAGGLAYLLNTWIENYFDLPMLDLIDLRNETPQSAAIALRQYWELGERPIKNMIHLLELKGIRVYSLAEDSLEVDAYSCWQEGKPFIFLNTIKSAEHSRFDAAHELAHLVLHRHGSPSGIDAEKEANTFASAFLMPESSIRAIFPIPQTLPQLIKLKHQWIVSLAALAYRLNTLNIITDWHYRMLAIEISKKGYRKQEPEPAQRETSQVLAKVFSCLKSEGISKNTIAKELKISLEEIEKLIFGLSMVCVKGGNSGKAQLSKASLTVIK